MAKVINVLVFPAGEVNSVELHDALATCVNIKLFGGSSVDRHGPYIFKNYISGIPMINEANFIESFNKLLEENEIDVVFPTHDTIATYMADRQGEIQAKVIAGDPETARVCRDKALTFEKFAGCDFTPGIYKDTSSLQLPAFAKPRIGAGSVGTKKIESASELDDIALDQYLICEYLPGIEYTVDCLTDKNGKLVVVSPRSRDRVMAGISVSGQTQEATEEIKGIAETINERLTFRGLWFFQIKQDQSGKFKLLEISVRVAGSMCLTRARGVNLPLLSVYTALDMDVEATPNNYKVTMDRTLISRYRIDYEYRTVYLDFDDTLIVNDKVNLLAAMFLYQCKNKGVPVHLITRHAYDLEETLARHGLDKNLFAEIIHLTNDDLKTASIKPENAIFIDNAYQERRVVKDEFDIPVFDVDGLEVLLDWRT